MFDSQPISYRRRNVNTLNSPTPGAWVTTNSTALRPGAHSTGKQVLEQHELNVGEILNSGGLLPTTTYIVSQEKANVSHGSVSGQKRITTKPYPGQIYSEYDGFGLVVRSCNPSPPLPHSIDYASLRQEAHADANSAAFDIMTNAAELGEAVFLLRHGFSGIRQRAFRVADLVRRRIKRGAIDGRRDVFTYDFQSLVDLFASTWLETRYGWQPIVSTAMDFHGVVSSLSGEKMLETVTGRARFQTESFGTVHGTNIVAIDGNGSPLIVGTTSRTTIARSFVTHQVLRMASDFGANPILTAWELVPFSFAVDWFVNISQIIIANYAGFGVRRTVAGSSKKVTLKADVRASRPPGEYTLATSPAILNWEQERYDRWADSHLPPPPVMISNKDRYHLMQMTDTVALFTSLLPQIVDRIWRARAGR